MKQELISELPHAVSSMTWKRCCVGNLQTEHLQETLWIPQASLHVASWSYLCVASLNVLVAVWSCSILVSGQSCSQRRYVITELGINGHRRNRRIRERRILTGTRSFLVKHFVHWSSDQTTWRHNLVSRPQSPETVLYRNLLFHSLV